MKKTLKIILIIILIGAFALFLFWLINPGRSPVAPNFISKVKDFSPFGGNGDTDNNNFGDSPTFFEGGEEVGERNPEDRILPDIEMVYSSPVGGYTVLGTGTSSVVRVVDRATGHIVDINTTTKAQTRISNTTLPGIIEALWFNDGKGVVMRYLKESSDTIETLSISNLSTDGGETAGTYLEEKISSILPISNSELAYVVPGGFGSKIGVYNTEKNSVEIIYTGAIQGFKVVGGDKTNIYVQTRASYISPGYLYSVSRRNGSLTKIGEGNPGFNSILSEDLGYVFGTTGGSNPISYLFDRESESFDLAPIKTVATKCNFSNEQVSLYCGVPTRFPQKMPDDWYMGLTTFTDQIWKYSSDTGLSFVTDLQKNTDVIKIELTENNDQLFFVDKNTGYVWIVRLSQL